MSRPQTLLGQFDYFDTIPVFDEHKEYDEEGGIAREFPEERLQEACKHYNSRAEQRGHYGVIGPGHTILRGKDRLPVPEMKQPPAWGIHANHTVGKLKDGTPAIFIDRYAKRGMVPDGIGGKVDAREAISQTPYTSVEYWTKDADGKRIPGYVGRVALLNQEPKRECGIFMYSKAGETVPAPKSRSTYADPKRSRPLAATAVTWGKGEALFYSMEQPMFDNDTPAEPLNDPAAGPNVGSLSADDLKALVEYLKTAGFQMAPPPAPPMDAPGGEPPLQGGLDAPGGAPPEPAMFAKAGTAADRNYAAFKDKEIAALKKQVAELVKARQDEKLDFSKRDAESRVNRLQREYGVKCDYDREVLKFSKMEMAERQAEEEYMAEHYAKDSQYQNLPPAEFIDTRGPQRSSKKDVDHDKVRERIRQTGCSVEEAVQHFAKTGA